MKFVDSFKSFITKLGLSSDKEEKINLSEYQNSTFSIGVIEFSDNVENDSGKTLAKLLGQAEYFKTFYYEEPFAPNILSLESRTIFDLIDKGQTLLERTRADVIIWGNREGEKIRLNFQTSKQYEVEDQSFVSLLDSLYIPAVILEQPETFPSALLSLISGAVLSALTPKSKEEQIYRKYLLKKIIHHLTQDDSAKKLPETYLPYILNFLSLVYLSYAYDEGTARNFKTINHLLNAALKHQDLITNPIHLGCIYYHIGQLYDSASLYTDRNPSGYIKNAIAYYRQAQKYLSKYTYAYDYGYISYKLADLFFNYWKQTEDLQALRDAVFQLREAEKIYTYAVFPKFWAEIQGKLGQMLALLGSITKSTEISEVAITSYRNQQKIVSEKRNPLAWGRIQESIADIHYHLGQNGGGRSHFEEALEYYHDALYIYENLQQSGDIKKVTTGIARTRRALNQS